jgi:UDP-N-acetylmuramoyl-tripeptide--D-alanyl-D-alanine ligase
MNLRRIVYLYTPKFPRTVIYMLQTSEYSSNAYLKWLWRTQDFSLVQHRKTLKLTKYARLLLFLLSGGMLIEIAAGIALIVAGIITGNIWLWSFAPAVILAYPIIASHLIVLPLEAGRLLVVKPKSKKKIRHSESVFAGHPAIKIAVAGSYGKTTMKEVLKTVLSQGLKVAATSANHNVPIEHAKFAANLSGEEEVLIIEYGEGAPEDVANFARVTHPTHAVITGLAPAHLDRYKTLDAAAKDIFSLATYLHSQNVYVNGESAAIKPYLHREYMSYRANGLDGWKVENANLGISGTSFSLHKDKINLQLHSRLIGRHQIGTLVLAAVLGLKLGLSAKQVEAGVAATEPFEHRMQPYELNGAWIIDDTYNGNIEGIKAGTELLSELPAAKRKIYVTPGLVDQGGETEKVHRQMGKYIAKAKPDIVVLMNNSVCGYIKAGINAEKNFTGELIIENDPLKFYTSLDQFVAKGDLVVMQNDWPDNYS